LASSGAILSTPPRFVLASLAAPASFVWGIRRPAVDTAFVQARPSRLMAGMRMGVEVLVSRHQDEVLSPIIGTDAVQVVDVLAARQPASDLLLDDVTMLVDGATPVDGDGDITSQQDAPAALVQRMTGTAPRRGLAGPRAEAAPSSLDGCSPRLEGLAALLAGTGNHPAALEDDVTAGEAARPSTAALDGRSPRQERRPAHLTGPLDASTLIRSDDAAIVGAESAAPSSHFVGLRAERRPADLTGTFDSGHVWPPLRGSHMEIIARMDQHGS
jgi:hypothetical protein